MLFFLILLVQGSSLFTSQYINKKKGLFKVEETWFTRRIYPLNSYKTAQMLLWRIPPETLEARWILNTNSSTLACRHQNVSVWLKEGGFPVVSTDGGRFPPQFLPFKETQHHIIFRTSEEGLLELKGPQPGNWFMMSAISPSATSNGCSTDLIVRVEYTVQEDIITIVPVFQDYQDIMIFNTISRQQYYRFYVSNGGSAGNVTITKCSLRQGEDMKKQRVSQCPVKIATSPLSLPTQYNKAVNCSESATADCSVQLITKPGTWHYLSITTLEDSPVEFAIAVHLKGCRSSPRQTSPMLVNKIDTGVICGNTGRRPLQLIFPPSSAQAGDICGPFIELNRRNRPGFFSFDFALPGNSTGPEMLSLKPGENTVLSFSIGEGDIGGTLAVELALILSRTNEAGIMRETMGCLSRGYITTPSYNHSSTAGYTCANGRIILQNSTQAANGIVFEQIMIPYPAAGQYYLTLSSHCYSTTQHRSSEDCRKTPIQVLFSVHSNSCISGTCGRYGQCYQYVSGGVLFSTCQCVAGHKGWGCNDPSAGIPDFNLLVTTLLLTLTNMATLPAVVLALFRGHYTESFVYFSNLISSSLYHACNQDIYTVCILNYSVLRFCDIYTGLLTSWVTILAMSALPHTIRSLFQMVGAIGISLAVQHNSGSSLTQTIPFLVGCCVLLISWIWRCSAHRSFYPGWKYLGLYCIPGVLVTIAGQLCLQLAPEHTHQQYLHASWHIAKGVALMLLLPEGPSLDEPSKPAPTSTSGATTASRNQLNQFQVPEVSFKHLTDSNQSSVDDMAAVTRMVPEDSASQHQL